MRKPLAYVLLIVLAVAIAGTSYLLIVDALYDAVERWAAS
jgi:hypothetical protein